MIGGTIGGRIAGTIAGVGRGRTVARGRLAGERRKVYIRRKEGSLIRVATVGRGVGWCGTVWDGVESACHRGGARQGVYVCGAAAGVGRVRGSAGEEKPNEKEPLCLGFLRSESRGTVGEREREQTGDATAICTSYCPREE